jgi:predicted nucleic acid-binding protein
MITAVFDCVIYVQAAISRDGPAGACLALVEDGQVKLFTSPPILAECQETLSRPKIRRRFAHLTDEMVESYLQRLGQIA